MAMSDDDEEDGEEGGWTVWLDKDAAGKDRESLVGGRPRSKDRVA